MSLSPSDRQVLADLQAGLARSDPPLVSAFDRLVPRARARWWLAGGIVGFVLATGAVELLGLVALGALAMLLVLGSPVVVAVATRTAGEIPEDPRRRPVRPSSDQKDPPVP